MVFNRGSIRSVFFVTVGVLVMGVVMTSPEDRRKRSDDPSPLESVVTHLSQQVTSLTAKMAAMEAKTARLDQTVAFHAWSDSNPLNVAAMSPVILNHVATNAGDAYSKLTGVFTAPVSGLYDFQASFMNNHLTDKTYIRAAIYVDSRIECITISDSRHGYFDHASMRAVVHVTAGQRVYVKNPDPTAHFFYDDASLPYTTFSGFLIRAD